MDINLLSLKQIIKNYYNCKKYGINSSEVQKTYSNINTNTNIKESNLIIETIFKYDIFFQNNIANCIKIKDILDNHKFFIVISDFKEIKINRELNQERNEERKQEQEQVRRFKWENICATLGDLKLDDLRELAAKERIPFWSMLSKREICAELSKKVHEQINLKVKLLSMVF